MLNRSDRILNLHNYLSIVILCFVYGCTGPSRFVPTIRPSATTETVPAKKNVPDTVAARPPIEKKTYTRPSSAEDDLDFSLAFADNDDGAADRSEETFGDPIEKMTGRKKSPAILSVPTAQVRIALRQNIGRQILYSLGTVQVHAGNSMRPLTCRGRMTISSVKKNGKQTSVIIEENGQEAWTVFLPCTLMAQSAQNYFEIEDKSYRGSCIVGQGNGATFSIINVCPVEEYLRGVVPLEIGKRQESDIEAVKAQAVAARTYTYRRILERAETPYDLVATVEDQVYGGLTAEDPLSDQAIRLTQDIVMVYGDSCIDAYYHSTCGGTTASISDVWGKEPVPYLKAISDTDPKGEAYCAISRQFTWHESWDRDAFSTILRRYCAAAFPDRPAAKGTIRSITIDERYPCGRVKQCRVQTTDGTYLYGGDKIRFAFRRKESGYPVLRSARLTDVAVHAHTVTISGSGFGHGVGMCQMGAIGRAREGQRFEEILKAYYTGVSLSTVAVKP